MMLQTPPNPFEQLTVSKDVQAAAVALVTLSEHNIPPDIQELLVLGNPDRDIRPGALSKAISAVIQSYLKELVPEGGVEPPTRGL